MAQRTACPQTPNYTIYKIRFHKGARPKQRRQEFKSQGEKESVFVVLGAGNTFLNGAENSGGEMEPGGGGCVDGTGSCSQSEVSKVYEGPGIHKGQERKASYTAETRLAQQRRGQIKINSLQNQKFRQPVSV